MVALKISSSLSPGVIAQRAAVGLAVEPKALALNLVYGCFLRHFPYMERVQGILDGVRRGPVGPPGPLGLAALTGTGEVVGVVGVVGPRGRRRNQVLVHNLRLGHVDADDIGAAVLPEVVPVLHARVGAGAHGHVLARRDRVRLSRAGPTTQGGQSPNILGGQGSRRPLLGGQKPP